MKKQLNKNLIERFSRQIILKNVGILGQKKILSAKLLNHHSISVALRAGLAGTAAFANYDLRCKELPHDSYFVTIRKKTQEPVCITTNT